MKKIMKPVMAAIIYTGVMAIGWALNPHDYGKLENVLFMAPFLIVLSLMSLYLIKRESIKFNNGKIRGSLILWMFITALIYLAITNYFIYSEKEILGPANKLLLLFTTTMLVGIAEEGMFRGYILNFIEKKLDTKKALFYSSIFFGLLHSVNFLAGQKISITMVQVVLTAIIGYVLGTIYLRSNRNLILVIVLHGLYDFLYFSSSYLANLNNSDIKPFLVMPLLIFAWFICLAKKG